jgi:hypothetical protein
MLEPDLRQRRDGVGIEAKCREGEGSDCVSLVAGSNDPELDPDESLHPIETLRGRGYRLAIARSDMTPTQGA